MNSKTLQLTCLTIGTLLVGCGKTNVNSVALREKHLSMADCQLILAKAAETDPAIRRRQAFWIDEIIALGKNLGVKSAVETPASTLRRLGRETAVMATWPDPMVPQIVMRVRTPDGVEEWKSDSNGRSKVTVLTSDP